MNKNLVLGISVACIIIGIIITVMMTSSSSFGARKNQRNKKRNRTTGKIKSPPKGGPKRNNKNQNIMKNMMEKKNKPRRQRGRGNVKQGNVPEGARRSRKKYSKESKIPTATGGTITTEAAEPVEAKNVTWGCVGLDRRIYTNDVPQGHKYWKNEGTYPVNQVIQLQDGTFAAVNCVTSGPQAWDPWHGYIVTAKTINDLANGNVVVTSVERTFWKILQCNDGSFMALGYDNLVYKSESKTISGATLVDPDGDGVKENNWNGLGDLAFLQMHQLDDGDFVAVGMDHRIYKQSSNAPNFNSQNAWRRVGNESNKMNDFVQIGDGSFVMLSDGAKIEFSETLDGEDDITLSGHMQFLQLFEIES